MTARRECYAAYQFVTDEHESNVGPEWLKKTVKWRDWQWRFVVSDGDTEVCTSWSDPLPTKAACLAEIKAIRKYGRTRRLHDAGAF